MDFTGAGAAAASNLGEVADVGLLKRVDLVVGEAAHAVAATGGGGGGGGVQTQSSRAASRASGSAGPRCKFPYTYTPCSAVPEIRQCRAATSSARATRNRHVPRCNPEVPPASGRPRGASSAPLAAKITSTDPRGSASSAQLNRQRQQCSY